MARQIQDDVQATVSPKPYCKAK
eukprot:COSAG02_NODE_15535_length_1162_cov_1.352775_2_plen_22_part_01